MSRVAVIIAVVLVAAFLFLVCTPEDVNAGRHPCRNTDTNQSVTLIGTSAGERLCGGNGNDTLIAKGGDDILGGNHGSDLLRGGPGDDRLWGGRGPDTFICGPGQDVVHQEFDTGSDTVDDSCEVVRT